MSNSQAEVFNDGIAPGLTIWVVDDELGILQVVEMVLTGYGHMVETFASSASLERKLALGPAPPDLVLVDAMLSGQSGLALAARLEAVWSNQAPTIVIMSGDSEVCEQIPQAMRWLRKPFRLDQLTALVEEIRS